ncbi:MAG: sulfatase-like hydrolase/transferase [Polyangiales bacterium]
MDAVKSSLQARATRRALALTTLLGMLLVHVLVIGVARFGAALSGLAFDVCLVGIAYLLGEGAAWLRAPARVVTAAVGATLALALGMVFAHAWFYDVAIERRLTLLDLSVSGLRVFFVDALSWSGRLALLVLTAAWVGGVWGMRHWRTFGRRAALGWGVAAIGLSGTVAGHGPIRSPLYDGAEEAWQLLSLPTVEPEAGPAPDALVAALDKSARTHAEGPPRFAKVIVLVMETMTARTFDAENAALAPTSFPRREAAHVQRFTRYYPNNQDSRTGMLDMLFSRVLPYEAYSDEGYAGYAHLAQVPSLVERMRVLGYRSAFAVSQTALEEVVGELSWDATLHLSEPEIAAARGANKLCFTPDVYEQSCEDLVLLPEVLAFVAAHERAFVYQEFIWGHAAEYNEASGLSNGAYYARYVDALLEGLRARALEDDTLIILTSDHGFRDKGRQRDPEVYRVPLWLYAPSLAPRVDTRLTSHADLGMLMLEALVPGAARADDNPLVMIVGPTGQGHTFAIDGAGSHVLLWHRLGGDRVIAQHGATLAPARVLAAMQRYRARFDAKRAR